MLDKLEKAEENYIKTEAALSDPAVISDNEKYTSLMKEYKSLSPIIEAFRRYKTAVKEMNEAETLMNDSEPEIKELAELEYYGKKEEIEKITEELKVLLLPKDENDDKNVIVEIRGGAGGEEAALFAAALYRMYGMYAGRL